MREAQSRGIGIGGREIFDGSLVRVMQKKPAKYRSDNGRGHIPAQTEGVVDRYQAGPLDDIRVTCTLSNGVVAFADYRPHELLVIS